MKIRRGDCEFEFDDDTIGVGCCVVAAIAVIAFTIAAVQIFSPGAPTKQTTTQTAKE